MALGPILQTWQLGHIQQAITGHITWQIGPYTTTSQYWAQDMANWAIYNKPMLGTKHGKLGHIQPANTGQIQLTKHSETKYTLSHMAITIYHVWTSILTSQFQYVFVDTNK